ncbi:MAG: hypothetical protein ABI629_15430 [bacterium]
MIRSAQRSVDNRAAAWRAPEASAARSGAGIELGDGVRQRGRVAGWHEQRFDAVADVVARGGRVGCHHWPAGHQRHRQDGHARGAVWVGVQR